ncbi:hypothetical protein GSI_05010 [Ganoderma sinense ZZ0214-1]|uniref:Uncharacterized protein n=1 Tax=Ganoderma sinense ZZ0214-1 TaxID=1077348 RepID=A0A2G8SGL0_9APHY|nr:hypothetical protein GSI_05010 [Ganoderma sinense ZZ0214-1]
MTDFASLVTLAPNEPQAGGSVLPFDVLSDIMAVSPPSTISALMKTCHALYTEGPKHLLCDGVQLDRSRDIASFANFMLTEDSDSSRFAHLRKLVVALANPGPFEYQRRLAELLVHHSLALETLVLHHADSFLEQSRCRLREAFCGLKTIKRLVVFGVLEYGAAIIQNIPSPVESMSISVANFFRPPDIAPMLRPFSNTLHTLLINSKNSPVYSLFKDLRPRDFPRVRTFGVVWDGSVPELLTTPAFALAFPAIKHLQLIPTAHPYASRASTLMSSFTPMSTFEELARNRARAGNHSQTPRGPPPGRLVSESSPPAVEECSGEVLSVYKLGLNCPLTTLRLWPPIRAEDLATLRVVLEETRPRHLCLPVTMHDVTDLFATFHALPVQAPTRVDLYIVGSWIPNAMDSASNKKAICPWTCLLGLSRRLQNRLYSILEPLFTRPPPHGLVELSLLSGKAPDREWLRPQGELTPVLGSVGEAFMRWASTATPPLAVTWRFYKEDELRWPDVGQSLDEDYDDEDSDDNYDREFEDHDLWFDEEDSYVDPFLEADGDEYDSDQWRRWNDDD